MKIVIVDYGMGNIASIQSAVKHIGYDNVLVADSIDELESADRLLLPGVGNFSKAMKIIQDKGLDEILSELVLVNKKPILGICLGMQLLGKSSTEGECKKGLGFIDGKVERFTSLKIKIPHVGFNQVSVSNSSRLYRGIKPNPDYYFTHSYRMTAPDDIGQSFCHYSDKFIASFEVNNIAGTQFHPELSQKNGLKLLNNFIELF